MHRGIAFAGLGGLIAALAAGCGASNGGSGGGGGDDAGHGDATSSGSGGSSGGSSGSSGGGGDSGIDGGQPASDPSVYQHHRNGTRDGLYTDPVFTQTAAATTHVLAGFMGTVSGEVYAQPLYVENGPNAVEAFVVVTEANHITTYNATTGAVIWDTGPGPTTIGPYATKNPPGGRVDSTDIGITGTPYIDITSRTIFFDAMTTPDNSATYHHQVYAVSLDTGSVLTNWPVDVNTAAPGFDSGAQNQRGALQFLKILRVVEREC